MVFVAKIKFLLEKISIQRILMLALAVRVVWYLIILLYHPEGFWLYDSNGYWNIAYNMQEHGIYSRDVQEPLLPDYFRTPLYPFLIYPTLWLDETGNTIPLIQIALDILTCYAVYRVLLMSTNTLWYARVGALMYALHIPAIITCNYVLSESVFACIIVCFVWAFLVVLKGFSYRRIIVCGMVGGLGVMCKPLGFILIFPALLFVLLSFKFNLRTIVAASLLTFTFYAVQFPWMQRNKQEFGRYFNSVIGEHLLLGYHTSYVYAKANNIDFSYAQDILRGKFDDGLTYDPYKRPYEYAKRIERESYKILWQHKWIFLRAHVWECLKFFGWPMGEYVAHQIGTRNTFTTSLKWFLIVLQVISNLVIYGLLLLYLIRSFRQKIRPSVVFLFLISIVLLFSQFTTMPYTDARMRFPIDPLLIILTLLSCQALKLLKPRKSIV